MQLALASDFVYRADDGRVLTFEEVSDELTPEMAEGLEGLPAEEQVIDGGDVELFLLDSDRYESVEARGHIVTQYCEGRSRWADHELREQVFSCADHDGLTFEDWLAAKLESGMLKAVDVLQFVGYADEGADEETVIVERLIVD
ncbi:MAG: hypothetical protein ACKOI2_05825 [Actinomycetota bacterium]